MSSGSYGVTEAQEADTVPKEMQGILVYTYGS